jgi:hypothetical protein
MGGFGGPHPSSFQRKPFEVEHVKRNDNRSMTSMNFNQKAALRKRRRELISGGNSSAL